MDLIKQDSAERELQLIRAALDQSAIVAITDAAGTIIHVNDHFCKISQYSRGELLGQNHRILNSGFHSKDFFTHLWKTISQGNTWEGDIKNKAKNGTYYWVHTTIVPLLQVNGKPDRYVSIRYEITEKVEAIERLNDYSKKLEASNAELQEFASIAAHDLQEPLRKILTFGDRIQTKFGPVLPPEAMDYFNRMLNSAARMRKLIDGLLAYARIHQKKEPFEYIDLNTVIKNVISDLEVMIEQNEASIKTQILPSIRGDSAQLHQLFQNLLQNALKFRKLDIPPSVTLSFIDTPSHHEIHIEDNGIGFDQKYSDRIFALFQRLHGKSEYEGTGLGLAICKRIAERHGGAIEVQSTPGLGSKFILKFAREENA